MIQQNVSKALELQSVDAIITCGGTGISPRDVTIESVKPLFEKELDGFGEIFRRLSFDEIGSAAVLTRATAGVSNGKVIFCIPGSPQAASVCLKRLISPEASHILKHTREE
jgi:molybdenum cofactor biosynthesis protein B